DDSAREQVGGSEMMPLRLLRVVGPLLALVVFAPVADAECAWVLWNWMAGGGWVRISYHGSQGECWTKITSATFVPREDSWTDKLGSLFRTERYKQWSAQRIPNGARLNNGSFQYACLPDTVDMRAPKGVGR